MEVDACDFQPRLLSILEAISNSLFVSIDLELSGIPPKGTSRGQPLQERYAELKKYAEKFQVLQVGLTCAQRDPDSDSYLIRPYNFNLNPFIQDEKVRVEPERELAMTEGSVQFLLRHGFSLDCVMREGVPYLSASEVEEATNRGIAYIDRSDIADLPMNDLDEQTAALLSAVTECIRQAMAQSKENKISRIFVSPLGASTDANANQTSRRLSGRQKRLIHQLLRKDFPSLRAGSHEVGMQIFSRNVIREARERDNDISALTQAVHRQKGLAWLFDALSGREIRDIDVRNFAIDPATGSPIPYDPKMYKFRLSNAHDRMVDRGLPPLVGHNVFIDLVFLYQCFFNDKLPDTVEEFSSKIHALFPRVIDTKYMATYDDEHSRSTPSSLEELAQLYDQIPYPKIDLAHGHNKYQTSEGAHLPLHEAGCDAYLTARLLIRQSAALETRGIYVPDDEPTANLISTSPTPAPPINVDAGVADALSSINLSPRSRAARRREEKMAKSNGYADGFANEDSENKTTWMAPPATATIPPWSADFWRVYGNTLRVWGTEEGQLHLGAWADGEGRGRPRPKIVEWK